jgi:glycosyl hydrolase family 59 (putative galactocerebrosidase)
MAATIPQAFLPQFLLVLTLAMALAPTMSAAESLSFKDTTVGAAPSSFELALTGSGSTGRWEVIAEETAVDGKALAQLGDDATDNRYPLAIYRPLTSKNVVASVRFKPIAGKVDRAGGIAVRLADAGHYYLARANALEDNVRFYRVVKGVRRQLASADTKVASGVWHTLSLRAEGDRFTVAFDGKGVLSVRDMTFTEPGKVALWTKADSITAFDAITIDPLP